MHEYVYAVWCIIHPSAAQISVLLLLSIPTLNSEIVFLFVACRHAARCIEGSFQVLVRRHLVDVIKDFFVNPDP